MQPTKGLYTDTRPLEQPTGTYPFAKNGIQYDLKGAVINEPGFIQQPAQIPYSINGIVETDSKPIIFSTDDTNSAIGYFNPDTGLYESIFDDSSLSYKLGFKLDNFITGVAQRNYKAQMVAAITDKTTFPKYFNADALNVKRLEDWNLFPYYTVPSITTSVGVGGVLQAGTYYAAVRYQKNDGTTTPYSSLSLGLTIPSNGSDLATDQCLNINLANTDTDYDFVLIAIIMKVAGITTAVELDPIPTNPNGVTIAIYTGNNLTNAIALEDIVTEPSVYTVVDTMGQLNDELFIAGLQQATDVSDMQPYANQVQIQIQSSLVNAVTPPAEVIQGQKKGFMHKETYALYIRYILTRGGKSQAFVIPGPVPLPADLLNSPSAASGGFAGLAYQVDDCIQGYNAGNKTVNPGPWQNQTEAYPNTSDFASIPAASNDTTGANAFIKVRHFKMPSVNWCKKFLYSDEPEYGKSKLDLLGIIASNVIIPDKYKDTISGYEILYAERTVANMTVLGQSLLFHYCSSQDGGSAASTNTPLYSTGANVTSWVKTRASTSYHAGNNLNPLRLDTFRFHAFDILFNDPSLVPTFMQPEIHLFKSNMNNEGGGMYGCMYQDGDNGNNSGQTCCVYLHDYTTGSVVASGTNELPRGINNGLLLQIGVNFENLTNDRHEACFTGLLNGPNWQESTANVLGYCSINARGGSGGSEQTDTQFNSGLVESYLTTMIQVKHDVYVNFYSQELVTAGPSGQIGETITLFGGDTYVNPFTLHTYGRHEATDTWAMTPNGGKKFMHRFICESVSNINLRYVVPGNNYTDFWPKTSISNGDGGTYIESFDRTIEPNEFGYSKDLNALNDLEQITVFSPYREDITNFPYRIHRGGKMSLQTKFRSWQSWLPLDYYECQKNMGLITHLEGMDDRLMIHHQNSLFYTQNKATMQGGTMDVTLGSGDIFQFAPLEVVSAKLGYSGTQHELACVRSPIGYLYVDAKQGEIYVYKDGGIPGAAKIENLNMGINRFLLTYMKGLTDINTFNGNGISIGWDQRFKRVLLTVKNIQDGVDNSFTASFSIEGKGWVFLHDYIPDHYFHTREQLWSIKSNKIYKHNVGAPGIYYNEAPASFLMDVVFQDSSDMLLESIGWITEMIQGDVGNQDVESEWSTLTHITIWNSEQHTGRIELQTIFENLQYKTDRRTQGTWNFNDFRDIIKERGTQFLMDIFNNYNLIPNTTDSSKPWYEKELMEDKYFVVRFEFDNVSGKQIILHDVNAQVIKSNR
jgi:hypothetical protein